MRRRRKRKLIITICLVLTMVIGATIFTKVKSVKADGVDADSKLFVVPFISINGKQLNLNDVLCKLKDNGISLQGILDCLNNNGQGDDSNTDSSNNSTNNDINNLIIKLNKL